MKSSLVAGKLSSLKVVNAKIMVTKSPFRNVHLTKWNQQITTATWIREYPLSETRCGGRIHKSCIRASSHTNSPKIESKIRLIGFIKLVVQQEKDLNCFFCHFQILCAFLFKKNTSSCLFFVSVYLGFTNISHLLYSQQLFTFFPAKINLQAKETCFYAQLFFFNFYSCSGP